MLWVPEPFGVQGSGFIHELGCRVERLELSVQKSLGFRVRNMSFLALPELERFRVWDTGFGA